MSTKRYTKAYVENAKSIAERHGRIQGFREGLEEGRRQLAAELRAKLQFPNEDKEESYL